MFYSMRNTYVLTFCFQIKKKMFLKNKKIFKNVLPRSNFFKKKKERIFWTSKVFRNLSLHKNHGIFFWAQNFFSFKIKTHKCFLEIFSTYTILFSFSSNLFFFLKYHHIFPKTLFLKNENLFCLCNFACSKGTFLFFLNVESIFIKLLMKYYKNMSFQIFFSKIKVDFML